MTYTITYEPSTMSGTAGYWYEIRSRGRMVGQGWSAGAQHHAERMAKADIRAIERSAAA